MKKLITLSFVFLLLLSLNAFATDTRVMTLGNTNEVLLDDANIWMYPSRINDYPNLAIGEFGSGDEFQTFGVHFKFNRDNPWVLGAYFDNLPTYYPEDLFGNNLLPGRFNNQLDNNHRINLFYGRDLGQMNFGFRVSALQSSHTMDEAADQSKQAFGYYNFNVGLTSNNGAWDLAGSLGLGSFTDENADSDPYNEADGFMDISVMGRMFHQINPNYTVIPHAGVMYSKRGLKNYDSDGDLTTQDYVEQWKSMAFELGAGINYTPATNVLAVADVGFVYYKVKDEYTPDGGTTDEYNNTNFAMPYFRLGLDADIFKWLDVRMGAQSIWDRETDEYKPSGDKEKWNYAQNDTYLGFGFHWNRFHVDAYTDPELFLDGFNFISGSTNTMNFQLSAVYEMM